MWAMWTLIWWVRPVTSRQWTRDAPGQPLDDGVEGSRWTAVIDHRHLLPVAWVAVDGRVHHAFVLGELAETDREIGLFDLAPTKVEAERLVGSIILRHHHETGGVFVEPVDDPGSGDPADPAEVLAVVEEGVDERTAGIARRRVDDEIRGLVDDQKIFVFEDDRQRDLLGSDIEELRAPARQ